MFLKYLNISRYIIYRYNTIENISNFNGASPSGKAPILMPAFVGSNQVYYDMYKAMYFDCATKGPKVGGEHAQETIDIAVPFFVNTLR